MNNSLLRIYFYVKSRWHAQNIHREPVIVAEHTTLTSSGKLLFAVSHLEYGTDFARTRRLASSRNLQRPGWSLIINPGKEVYR